MERLTNSIDYCQMRCENCFFKDKSHCYENNIYNRLREYEITEEQGLLLRLPCKVNDEVWAIRNYKGVTYAQKGFVNEMFFTKDMRLVIVVKNIARGEFGKKVFLTKEEAEQALKQMGE
jgi:hypothetical protein